MRSVIGSHDLLVVALDALRYDVAEAMLGSGQTPNLRKALPKEGWQRTQAAALAPYAAHHAFLAGCLPSGPGRHRPPFVARTPGRPVDDDVDTWVFDATDVVSALAREGYHTLCLGGGDAFAMTSPQGGVLPALFAEAHWARDFGAASPHCFEAQLDRLKTRLPAADGPLFVFVDVAAVHPPNLHYLEGDDTPDGDSIESHGAALAYVDRHLPTLFQLMTGRGRPCRTIIRSSHGTAYDDGDEALWAVPYAQLDLRPGDW